MAGVPWPPVLRLLFTRDGSGRQIGAKGGFPWRKAVRGFISVAVVAAIFVFAIPKFASYGQVWPILKGLSAAQIVWLVLAQFLSRAAYWSVYVAALPGLGFWPSAVLIQTNSAVASVLRPAAPSRWASPTRCWVRGGSPTPRSPS